ncbi:MAG: ATP-binding protein [Polyangia bacterium]|jgi:signal transduction histidine kinase|nr:ATP-binding protein [Polyangia bacterium]
MSLWRTITRQPRVLSGLLVLCGALVIVPVLTWRWVEADRRDQLEQYSRDRLVALRISAKEVEEDIQDVEDDLAFVTRLMKTGLATRTMDIRPLFMALLGTSSTYRGFVLVHESSQPWLWISDPEDPLPSRELLEPELHATIDQLSRLGSPDLAISPAIEVEKGAYRVFAARLQPPWHCVALIVDMEPYLERLGIVAADPNTSLLVIGPWGTALSMSDPALRDAFGSEPEGSRAPLAVLRQLMRKGDQGTMLLSRAHAASLGLGNDDIVAAYYPIRLHEGGHFSAATLTSLAAIRWHERSLLLKLVLGAAAMMLLLLGLGVFIVHTSYRHEAMVERLRHAQIEAHLHEVAQKILQSIPSGVMLLDEGNRVVEANRAIRDRLPAIAQGRALGEVFGEARETDRQRLEDIVSEARRGRSPRSLVAEHCSLFGVDGYYRILAIPLLPSSPQGNLLLVLDDISELKRLQERLLRAEKLATTGTIAAGIAHEIGTPLSVIRGRTEHVLSKLDQQGQHAAGLKIVIEQTDRIVRTIRELLDYSRTSPTVPADADLRNVVATCLELLRFELQRRQIGVEVDLPPGLPSLAANPDQLQQVLINLLMNGIDASPKGESIEIRAFIEAPIVGEPPGDFVRIEVRDHGAGIEPAALHMIFDPFYTTKKRGQGTGLGLFIVAHIVHSHNGSIDLESTPGQGTKAILRWPALLEVNDGKPKPR